VPVPFTGLARGQRYMPPIEENLTAAEQALMEEMRAADAQPGSEAPTGNNEAPLSVEPPEQKPVEDEPKMVRHEALREEREERKAVEKRLRESEARWESRFNQLLQRVPQPQENKPAETAPAIPDVAADPVGHILGKIGATEQKAAEAVAQQQQIAQAFQAQQIETGLRSWAMGQEAAFKAENPQYEKAVEFIKSMRDAQLQAFGVTDAGMRAQRLGREQLEIAAHAYQQNMNPADIIMKMALASGFKPTEAQKLPSEVEATLRADPPNVAPAVSAAEQRMGNVQAGQQQARSLGNARGTAPAGLTAARILEMSDADFSKAMETPEGIALLGS
jgi:hypothetical protein